MSTYGIAGAAVGTFAYLHGTGTSLMPSLAAGAAVGCALLVAATTGGGDDGTQSRSAETPDEGPRDSGDYGVLRPSSRAGPGPAPDTTRIEHVVDTEQEGGDE